MSEFSQQVYQWIGENCPIEMRTAMPAAETVWGGRQETFASAAAKLWFQRMADKGWLAPTWPQQYGGAGLSDDEEKQLKCQLQKLKCRPAIMSLGIWMMGPTIMEFGTKEQKSRFLADIAQGRTRWCQGYSEPGSGSDLASLRCKAELDATGKHFIVTGQKVWTSYADKSDFLFCLVRTDFNASKHEGISVLLIDMASPGVTTKPIELISGSSHFCEVFLDHVSVPKENLLGEINKGWTIARRMLQHERQMMGQVNMGDNYSPDLAEIAKAYLGTTADEGIERLTDVIRRDQIAASQMHIHTIATTSDRVAAEIKAGELGMAGVILKYAMTLAQQDKFELMTAIMGNKGLGWQDNALNFSEQELRAAKELLFSKVLTIGGGTSEVQLNIIAKQILQLPK